VLTVRSLLADGKLEEGRAMVEALMGIVACPGAAPPPHSCLIEELTKAQHAVLWQQLMAAVRTGSAGGALGALDTRAVDARPLEEAMANASKSQLLTASDKAFLLSAQHLLRLRRAQACGNAVRGSSSL
jgi:hypothetical protein